MSLVSEKQVNSHDIVNLPRQFRNDPAASVDTFLWLQCARVISYVSVFLAHGFLDSCLRHKTMAIPKGNRWKGAKDKHYLTDILMVPVAGKLDEVFGGRSQNDYPNGMAIRHLKKHLKIALEVSGGEPQLGRGYWLHVPSVLDTCSRQDWVFLQASAIVRWE